MKPIKLLLLLFALTATLTFGATSARAASAPESPNACTSVGSSATKDKCIAADTKDKDSKASKAKTGKDPVSGKSVEKTSVIDYINGAYKWASILGGLLAVLMLVYAGYRYMTSYGDPEKIADAKQIIEQALIGLSLLILAALILQTINPDTLKCTHNCGNIDFSQAASEK